MTMYPKFDRNPKGRFDETNDFSQVVIGTDAVLLEDELNEMQAILHRRIDHLYDLQGLDGLKGKIYFSMHPTRPRTMVIPPFTVQVSGKRIKVRGIDNDGSSPGAEAGSNFIELYDDFSLLVLEVKEEVVSGPIDGRLRNETSRRLRYDLKLRNLQNELQESFNSLLNALTDPGGNVYKYDRNLRWRSENGYFAIPVFFVNRISRHKYSISLIEPLTVFDRNASGDITKVREIFDEREIRSIELVYNEKGNISKVITNEDGVKRSMSLFYSGDTIVEVFGDTTIQEGEK